MAKIGNLSVTTIKIKDNAVTGSVQNSNMGNPNLTLAVPNPIGFPIIVTSAIICVFDLRSGGDRATFRMRTTRARDGVQIADRSQTFTGVSSGSSTLSDGALDGTVPSSETYTLNATVNLINSSGAASASLGEKLLRGLYTKR